jgi:hypothetical protein
MELAELLIVHQIEADTGEVIGEVHMDLQTEPHHLIAHTEEQAVRLAEVEDLMVEVVGRPVLVPTV